MILRIFFTATCLLQMTFCSAQGDPRFFEGIKLYNQHKYQEALDVFTEIQDSVSGITIEYYVASSHFRMKNFELAQQEFESIVKKYNNGPEVGWAWVDLGSCYRSLDQAELAIQAYTNAGERFPESNGWYHLGMYYASMNNAQEAFEAYSKHLSFDSLNPRVYAKRMEVDFELKLYDYALNDILKAKELDANYDIPMNEAFCYSMLEKYDLADSVYESIENKDDPYYLNNCGFNKFKLGEIEQGKEMILKSLEMYSYNSFAYRNLALIAIYQDHLSDACTNLFKAKELKFEVHFGAEVNQLIEKYCQSE